MEIGPRLFAVICITILAVLQVGAWYMGFDGQLTIILTSTIVGLIALVTGLKIDLRSYLNSK